MEEQSTKYIVGLGNPGSRYRQTRHNVGFMVLAELLQRWNAPPPRHAFQGEFWDVRLGSQRVMLLAPATFMNLSGASVQEMLAFYKAPLSDVLVVLDDLALPTGQLRFRTGGSSGGQKGLSDILARLGTQEVPRLRVGIGQPPPRMEAADYVLGVFGPQEQAAIKAAIELAAQAVEDWVYRGLNYAMERYNRKGQEAQD